MKRKGARRGSIVAFGAAAAAIAFGALSGCSTSSSGTPTATRSPTLTFTITKTGSRTRTSTPTDTASRTPTATRTETATRTVTRTFTFSCIPGTCTITPTPVPANYVYIVGGYDSVAVAALSTVYTAQLLAAGAVGTWGTTAPYPITGDQIASVPFAGNLFSCCGYNGAVSASVNRGGAAAGVVSGWISDVSLPVALAESAVVADGSGYVYVIGGYTTSPSNAVYSNTMSGSGLGGSWTSTTALPAGSTGLAAAVSSSGYVYALGGGAGSTVYSATIGGGAVGGWASVGTLPTAEIYMGYVTDGNTVYLAGGQNGNASLWAADLQGGGALGSWTTVALPAGNVGEPGLLLYGGYVYLFGGYSGSSVSSVYSATASGTTVGSWVSQTAMPIGNGYLKAVLAP